MSELKSRQWEISKNAVIILAFLATVFGGGVAYLPSVDIPNWLKYGLTIGYFIYFALIFYQVHKNLNRHRKIYIQAGKKLYSPDALSDYFDGDPTNMVEDEGRLEFFQSLVVLASFVLVLVAIHHHSLGQPLAGCRCLAPPH